MCQGARHELHLEGLDEAAVEEVLHHLRGQISADPTLAHQLCLTTGGNPFFLLETLAALIEAGAGRETVDGVHAFPLPDSVRQAVQSCVERLSPAARQVLEAAAVIGQAFAGDTLQLTAGCGEVEIADSLGELATRQLLVEEQGLVRFRHEIVREAVVLSLGVYRRQLLHQRAAEALERLHPEEAAALARHLAGAGRSGPAARYALQVGLTAKRVFAHVEARSHFDQALALLEQEAAGLRDPAAIASNRRRHIQALSKRGWALSLFAVLDQPSSQVHTLRTRHWSTDSLPWPWPSRSTLAARSPSCTQAWPRRWGWRVNRSKPWSTPSAPWCRPRLADKQSIEK